MSRKLLVAAAVCLSSLAAFSQAGKQKIEQQHKDPKTKENAAKADVYVSKKRSICDTSTKRLPPKMPARHWKTINKKS